MHFHIRMEMHRFAKHVHVSVLQLHSNTRVETEIIVTILKMLCEYVYCSDRPVVINMYLGRGRGVGERYGVV